MENSKDWNKQVNHPLQSWEWGRIPGEDRSQSRGEDGTADDDPQDSPHTVEWDTPQSDANCGNDKITLSCG